MVSACSRRVRSPEGLAKQKAKKKERHKRLKQEKAKIAAITPAPLVRRRSSMLVFTNADV
jgi:hypothetical protein